MSLNYYMASILIIIMVDITRFLWIMYLRMESLLKLMDWNLHNDKTYSQCKYAIFLIIL